MTTAYATLYTPMAVVVVVAAANVRIVVVPVVDVIVVVVAALVDAVCRCGCRIALEWRANINKCVQND